MLDHDTPADADAFTRADHTTARDMLLTSIVTCERAANQALEALADLDGDHAFDGTVTGDLEVALGGTARTMRMAAAVTREATR